MTFAFPAVTMRIGGIILTDEDVRYEVTDLTWSPELAIEHTDDPTAVGAVQLTCLDFPYPPRWHAIRQADLF